MERQLALGNEVEIVPWEVSKSSKHCRCERYKKTKLDEKDVAFLSKATQRRRYDCDAHQRRRRSHVNLGRAFEIEPWRMQPIFASMPMWRHQGKGRLTFRDTVHFDHPKQTLNQTHCSWPCLEDDNLHAVSICPHQRWNGPR